MLGLLKRSYNFKSIDHKWQEIWQKYPKQSTSGEKFYCLSMFPYPSGSLHLGHVRVYSISDSLSRFEQLRGKSVLHPMGWDAFGLPAENAAIERKIPASEWTQSNILSMKSQLLSLGFLFDWDREISTCSEDYYKWTQFIFLLLYKKGLAYRKSGYINWDPVDQTVLANEQVDTNGNSWRSGAKVERKLMKQWYFKITDYAEELLEGLNHVNWPESVIEMQKGWIGKSSGFEVKFRINSETVAVFTTKIETVMGATFLALAPEHELVDRYVTTSEKEAIDSMRNKDEVNRKLGKHSVLLSQVKAIHPITNKEMPVAVAEYVLMDVGSGCVMGVPAHDSRDKIVAVELGFPIVEVLSAENTLVNSGPFDGLNVSEARVRLSQALNSQPRVNFRMKDWLVSRQRYWGVPIPIIHCQECGEVPDENLPVLLPKIEEKREWTLTKCPSCGKNATREVDTLDTFVDSSWYYLRYVDSNNSFTLCDKNLASKWTPVDVYIGGIEHAIMHLLYARFIHKFLRDQNFVLSNEPFQHLLTQGLVLGPTYKTCGKYISEDEAKVMDKVEKKFEKMSKSKKNGVVPEEIIKEFGVDTLRLAILFAAPSEKEIEWDGNLLKTMKKWLGTVSQIQIDTKESHGNYQKLIKDITRCMEIRKFHVAIARLMEYLSKIKEGAGKKDFENFLIMLYPFAPHLASEIYEQHFHDDIRNSKWPTIEK